MTEQNPELEFIEPECIKLLVIIEDKAFPRRHLVTPAAALALVQAATMFGPLPIQVRIPTDLDIELAAAHRLGLSLGEYRTANAARARSAAAFRARTSTRVDEPVEEGPRAYGPPPGG
jgi:hypothetical protein